MFWTTFLELCKKNNTTPNGVCKQLGLSSATATYWKNGKVPHHNTLLKLSDHFNVSVDYLLGKEQKEKPTAEGDRLLIEALEIMKTLSPEEQAQAMKYLAFLADSSKKQ